MKETTKGRKYQYTAIWHDAGMLVKRSDGKRLACCKRRSDEELSVMSEKDILSLASKGWRKFE